MSALAALLSSFRQAAVTEREKGTYFEDLVVAYLRNEPTYQDLYSEAWTYGEWAKSQRLDARDTGIDLVAKTAGTDELHAIQCKFYAPNYRVQKADIDSFFTASGKKPFAHRVIVATTDLWSEHAEAALFDQQPPVTKIDLQALEDSQIDWTKFKPKAPPVLKPKKELRPHQVDALKTVTTGLLEADRGKLIMACGTGKTFTALKIAETVAGQGKRVLFLVPSLALLSQTLTEWTQETSIPLHSFAVCSDSDVGKKREKDRNPKRLTRNLPQLLEDAELLDGDQLTYAALILLGTRKALNRYLGQSEVIFEYRSGETPGPAQERQEFREGALLFLDRLWELVSKRNDLQSWQDGLFMKQVPTFNEGAVRESILNAIAHRDYRLHGSVFVRQYPRRIRIESPGGFLPGITPETILHKQAPRNRRLAEALSRCGLVERSGQGYDRILEACILESKPRPRFDGTDDFQVFLTLDGQVQDVRFLRLLEAIGQEQVHSFDTDHLLLLDLTYRQQTVPTSLRPRVHELVEAGILEHVGRKVIPSRRLMALLGEKGKYTRLKGLERPAQRELILQHIRESKEGARFDDLQQVLPSQPERAIKGLLQTLKAEGLVHTLGKTKGARWFSGPASNPEEPND